MGCRNQKDRGGELYCTLQKNQRCVEVPLDVCGPLYKKQREEAEASEKSSDPQPKKPWRGICSPGCWNAKGKKCLCKCGGAHHGKGRRKGKGELKDEATG